MAQRSNHIRCFGSLCLRTLGAVFLLSAVLKTASFLDFAVQVSYYGILREPFWVQLLAVLLIGVEAMLGAGLLLLRALRRRLLILTLLLLVVFSALIAYAWAFRGIQNCGCFGKYLEMGPGTSLLKNGLLAFLAMVAWFSTRARADRPDTDALAGERLSDEGILSRSFSSHSAKAHSRERLPLLLTVGTGIVLASVAGYQAMDSSRNSGSLQSLPGPLSSEREPSASHTQKQDTFSEYKIPWHGKILDLSKGLYLVAMLSDSCEACAEIVSSLDEYAENPDLPQIVAFILSDDKDLQGFRDEYRPDFPTQAMPPLEFLDCVGKAPPRFILVKDGRQVRHWDGAIPDEVALLEAVLELP